MDTVTNSLSRQFGSNSGVDTIKDSTDNLGIRTNESSQSVNLGVGEVLHGPALPGLRDMNGIASQHGFTLPGVSNLWMELDTVNLPGLVGDTTVWGLIRCNINLETFRRTVGLITVGYPSL